MIIFIFEKIDLNILFYVIIHNQVQSNNIMPIQLRNKKFAMKSLIRPSKNDPKIVPDESSDSDDFSDDSGEDEDEDDTNEGSCESTSILSDSDDDDSDYVEPKKSSRIKNVSKYIENKVSEIVSKIISDKNKNMESDSSSNDESSIETVVKKRHHSKRRIIDDESSSGDSSTDKVVKKRHHSKRSNEIDESVVSEAFNIIFGNNYDDGYDTSDEEDDKINQLLNDDDEVCNSDDEKVFMKENYIDTKTKKNDDIVVVKKTNNVCKEYSNLLELKGTLERGLLLKPECKVLKKASKNCKNEINKLVKKSRNENTKEYYDLLQNDKENTCEIEYFKNKLSNSEQIKITKELKEIRGHMNVDKPYRLTLLQADIPAKYKATVLHKLNIMKSMEPGGPEYYKMKNWIDTFMKVPFNIYKNLSVKMTDGRDACNDYMVNAKKTLDDCVYGLDDAKLQILQMMGQWITNPSAMGTSIAIHGPPGSGKCHGLDTPILMYDGTIKMIQDVIIGDVVMGDDSNPRNVLSLGQGQDELYDINTNGGKYIVNSEHILCLKQDNILSSIEISYAGNKTEYNTQHFNHKTLQNERTNFDTLLDAEKFLDSCRSKDNTVEISVKDYLNLPKHISSNLYGYKVGVDFNRSTNPYSPYTFGLWLGSNLTSLTSVPYSFKQFADSRMESTADYCEYNLKNEYDLGLTKNIVDHKFNGTKHIPYVYKVNSEDVRLNLLSGIIDATGYLEKNRTFKIIRYQLDKLTYDILFLSRSLGFPSFITNHTNSFNKTFYEIEIRGNIGIIPIKCMRNNVYMGVEYPSCSVINDPYTLGVWNGDRTIGDNEMMFHHGCSKQEKCREKFYTRYNTQENRLVVDMLYKHIPTEYKLNTREIRMEVLAGIIDSCGYIHRTGCYRMICFDSVLADDIIMMSDSLGFNHVENIYDRNWKVDGVTVFGKYHSIDIYGLLHKIPVKAYRNKIDNSRKYHNSQSFEIIVTPRGVGDYYGFELDGNNRYVLGEFDVTHNTSIVKDGISKILGREFAFIALGGAGDSSFLEGHSYTYEGSTWGKIVQIIIDSKCMNPVIYFDELDKISDSARGQEIASILTHLTDTTQNNQFQDKFFSEIEFDLSKCLFIFSYNDETKVNPILKDRMYRIQTTGYDCKQKMVIARKYILPKIREQVNFEENEIIIQNDALEYIITNPKFSQNEQGVRNLKRCLEIIYTKLNLFRLVKDDSCNNIFGKELELKVKFPYTVTKQCVDILIKNNAPDNHSLLAMYV